MRIFDIAFQDKFCRRTREPAKIRRPRFLGSRVDRLGACFWVCVLKRRAKGRVRECELQVGLMKVQCACNISFARMILLEFQHRLCGSSSGGMRNGFERNELLIYNFSPN